MSERSTSSALRGPGRGQKPSLPVLSLARVKQAMLDEMKLPDFKGRHFFTARLRIMVFLAAWAMFFVFYPGIWTYSPISPLIFNIGFFVTAVCYWMILNERSILPMIILEAAADVLSQTTMVYVLGIESWAPFFLYGIYVTAAGNLYGYFSSLMAATLVLICYTALVLLINSGIIPPFLYPQDDVGFLNIQSFKPFFNLTFLPLSLVVIVYAAKIGNHFAKIKEKALERRNVQLMALNKIGATIRKALQLRVVINQVLQAIVQGLGFDLCLLALVDKSGEKVSFYAPEDNFFVQRLEEILGMKLSKVSLPVTARDNSAYMAIQRNRVIIRNDFTELTRGMVPAISADAALRAQKALDFKKFVITPLVAEQKVVGALIGATTKSYVDENVIDTLDNFANQAALALESAQLFEELEEKNKQLLEANRIKSDFLAIMSHELRTPLIAVIGYSEILIDNILGELNDEQRNSLKEVLRNADELLELINNILDLAKIESGKMVLHREAFDLAGLVRDVQNTVLPLLAKKQQTFLIHARADLPKISADSMKMRQILVNLVGNATKFTQKEGRIEVLIDEFSDISQIAAATGLTILPTLPKGPIFLLRVRDSGVGLKPEHLDKIFELFSQIDSTYTRQHQGTGIGLALTKELVMLHHGVITVSSEFGKGTEFQIYLPQNF